MDGKLWLTQGEVAEQFDTTRQNVSLHAKNILQEGELPESPVVKGSLTTVSVGKTYTPGAGPASGSSEDIKALERITGEPEGPGSGR